MTEPYLGEIQIFGFNFNPRGWALCNGATLPIQQNSALYALLGPLYGGNGSTTFQLPNFASRLAIGQGAGPGLTPRTAGQTFGVASVTVSMDEMPMHTHGLSAYTTSDTANLSPTAAAGVGFGPRSGRGSVMYVPDATADVLLSPAAVSSTGSNQSHNNNQPVLGLNFSIALLGTFPSFQ